MEGLDKTLERSESQKHLLSKEEKKEMTSAIGKEMGMISEKVVQLSRDLNRLNEEKKNSKDYVQLLDRSAEDIINEMQQLTQKLRNLQEALRSIETEDFRDIGKI